MTTIDPTQLQVREFATRATADSEERQITGIGVPLNERIRVFGDFHEEFATDCEFEGLENAKLMADHRTLVGRIVATGRVLDKLQIVARVSETAAGDDALTLARDGAYDSFSIGFTPLEWDELDDGTWRYTKVRAREFSLTPFPAYDSAAITGVRHQPTPAPKEATEMTDTLTRSDVEQLLEAQGEDFTRTIDARLAGLDSGPAAPLGDQWRSVGDYIKSLADGDEAAATFHREYTGGVLADSAPHSVWLGDAIKLVEARRKIINLFTRGSLPASGNVLEWYQLKSDTSVVERQAAEGDDLPFGKVELEHASTNVDTYGGYTQLSRQQIERSTAPALTIAHRALTIAYARATETAAAAYFYTALEAQAADGNKLDLPGSIAELENADWLDLIVDAADIYEDRGFNLDGLIVGKDVFKTLYRLEDGAGQNLMNVYGTGVNVSGSINVKGISGNLANVPVRLAPGAPAGTIAFYDPVAMTTAESPGAPMQLQDENIINLSKAFSVYGYMAHSLPFPGALLPVVSDADGDN